MQTKLPEDFAVPTDANTSSRSQKARLNSTTISADDNAPWKTKTSAHCGGLRLTHNRLCKRHQGNYRAEQRICRSQQQQAETVRATAGRDARRPLNARVPVWPNNGELLPFLGGERQDRLSCRVRISARRKQVKGLTIGGIDCLRWDMPERLILNGVKQTCLKQHRKRVIQRLELSVGTLQYRQVAACQLLV